MGTTERLVLNLPGYLVARVRESVRSGVFASEDDAIEKLLRAWYGDEELAEPPIEALRAFVAEGIADVDEGRVHDAGDVFDELLARIDNIAAKNAK